MTGHRDILVFCTVMKTYRGADAYKIDKSSNVVIKLILDACFQPVPLPRTWLNLIHHTPLHTVHDIRTHN